MRKFTWLLMAVILAAPIQAETLAGLLERFQWRIGEPDTAIAFLPDTALQLFLNDAQNSVTMLNHYLPKRVDITFSPDSTQYSLPADFKLVEGVLAYFAETASWQKVSPNPYFQIEGDSLQFFIGWEHQEQAEIYFKGIDFAEGVTIRVFYRAKAPPMDNLTDSCYVPADLQNEIISEAASYYEHAMHNYAAFQLLNQSVRLDLGVIRPQGGK